MKRKICLTFALTAALAMLTACGGNNENVNTADSTSAAADVSETESITEDITEESAEEDIPAQNDELTEKEQIQALLNDSRKIFFDYVLGKEMLNHVEWDKSVTIPSTDYLGESFDMPIYEIVDGDVLSVAAMQDKMRPFFTDKMIDYIFTECNYYYYEENGKLYVSDGVGSEGGGVGADTVYVTSAEYPDDDTVVLNMIQFGAGENWDIDHDIEENFTVTLKRSGDGFKIDECDYNAIGYLAWCYIPEDDVFDGRSSKSKNQDSISDEEIDALIEGRANIISLLMYSSLDYDPEITVSQNGIDYYMVTDENFDEWDEWTDYVKSIYSDSAASMIFNDSKLIEVDGKTYTNDGSKGNHLSEEYSFDIVSADGDTVTVLLKNADNFSSETVETEIVLENTSNGWRIQNY